MLKSGVNAGADSPAKDRLIINGRHLALEAASLRWIDGGRELLVRTPTSLTTFAACKESQEIAVTNDIWRGGACPIAVLLHLVGLF